ncbi:MAG: MBL fold metallo-hydrolase, partial [Euryarchaeota archaeon]|nr:MBL fold metallo-hydrolase [Euryarchaeota archaeon]
QRPYMLQRLTDRVYWVESFIYQSTFLVGREGVLVIDPLSYGRGRNVLNAIREVTDLPVTAIVYSHFHFDHVGDAPVFVSEASRTGKELRIIASEACVEEIRKYGNRVPLPTEVLKVPYDTFDFEGERIRVGTPPPGHSDDNSWILLPLDGVVHNVDMIHPGQIEFDNFGVGHYIRGYEEALRELLTLDWSIMTAGHGNIGSREDVQFVLDYIADLRVHTQEVLPSVDIVPFIRDEMMYNWFHNHRDEVARRVVERMRPKWGAYSGFELVAMTHARTMYWEYYLH